MATAVVASLTLTINNNQKQVDSAQISQRAGCERTNNLRAQLNAQSKTFLAHNDVTYRLFVNLGKTKGLPPTMQDQIKKAVAGYRSSYRAYKPLAIINCAVAYPAPSAKADAINEKSIVDSKASRDK
jgi:hypothetical protein